MQITSSCCEVVAAVFGVSADGAAGECRGDELSAGGVVVDGVDLVEVPAEESVHGGVGSGGCSPAALHVDSVHGVAQLVGGPGDDGGRVGLELSEESSWGDGAEPQDPEVEGLGELVGGARGDFPLYVLVPPRSGVVVSCRGAACAG